PPLFFLRERIIMNRLLLVVGTGLLGLVGPSPAQAYGPRAYGGHYCRPAFPGPYPCYWGQRCCRYVYFVPATRFYFYGCGRVFVPVGPGPIVVQPFVPGTGPVAGVQPFAPGAQPGGGAQPFAPGGGGQPGGGAQPFAPGGGGQPGGGVQPFAPGGGGQPGVQPF